PREGGASFLERSDTGGVGSGDIAELYLRTCRGRLTLDVNDVFYRDRDSAETSAPCGSPFSAREDGDEGSEFVVLPSYIFELRLKKLAGPNRPGGQQLRGFPDGQGGESRTQASIRFEGRRRFQVGLYQPTEISVEGDNRVYLIHRCLAHPLR